MENYDITFNPVEIISGTSNTTSPLYIEAAKSIESDTPKGMEHLKNFITSVEKVASAGNVPDSRLSSTKGNIKNFQGYENIQSAIEFLSKNLSGVKVLKDLIDIHNALEGNQAQYVEGYSRNIRLIVLEYESALYMLVTGLSHTIATHIDIVQTGTQIAVRKKAGSSGGVITKTIAGLASKLKEKSHKEYLNHLIKAKGGSPKKEEAITESIKTVGATLDLLSSLWDGVTKLGTLTKNIFIGLKRTMFGILPLIRSVLYLRYKKKADTVLALEQQIHFIKLNIEQLKNIKTMDEGKKKEIIKKQQAVIEAYQKKAEKLRAELTEGEKEASESIKKENPSMGKEPDKDKKPDDGELVIESGEENVNFNEAADQLRSKRLAALEKRHSKKSKTSKSSLQYEITEDEKDLVLTNRVLDEFTEKTKRETQSIYLRKLTPAAIERSKRTDTKLGGIPYWPKDMAYPTFGTSKKKPMVLMVQFNLSTGRVTLPGFPSSGIFQIFVDSEDQLTKGYVVHHKNILSDDKLLEEIPITTLTTSKSEYSDFDFPFTGQFDMGIRPKAPIPMTTEDHRFNETFFPIFNKHFNSSFKSTWELPFKVREIVHKRCFLYGTRLGGYPFFTQYDPRDTSKSHDDKELLFQLDSDSGLGIEWGDSGVWNCFLSDSDLKKGNFSNVLTYWDCH